MAVGGEGAGDKGPEGAGVIKLAQMAEFVDDNVVSEVSREKGDFIVEAQITLSGTASPP